MHEDRLVQSVPELLSTLFFQEANEGSKIKQIPFIVHENSQLFEIHIL